MSEEPAHHHGHRARLRERFMRGGLDNFADHEAVELLLTLCIPRRDVKPLAKKLLAHFGSLKGILDAPMDELQQLDGMGQVTPVALRIIKETMVLYLRQQAEQLPMLDSVDALIDLFRARLGELKHEVFEVAYLNHSYQLMKNGVERLEEGLANRATVYPQKVARAALQRHAVYVVIAHNHPTGELEPSQQDLRLTTAIKAACDAVGINLLDHIIATSDGATSFLDRELL
ncbi:JAB domain-containing protein [Cerasicoccus fimbriatus]|uniref:JAB domain-containing protein n=1 Tax=Cerasicoccus fimbriatus TaxID=3014554 RepID=UPI0022B2BB65|nr:DNA repair protein RadC [Cerasicoccus sp. TK19100]